MSYKHIQKSHLPEESPGMTVDVVVLVGSIDSVDVIEMASI